MTDPFKNTGQEQQNAGSAFNQQPTQISQQHSPHNVSPTRMPSNGQPQFRPEAGRANLNGAYQYYGGGSPPPPLGISIGARVTAHILSVLKALPLAGLIIFMVVLVADDELQNELEISDGDTQLVATTIVVLALLGFALLIGQMVMAAKNSRTGLLVFASILLAIDAISVFSTLISLFSPQQNLDVAVTLAIIILATGSAQLFVVIGTAKSQKPTPLAQPSPQQQRY